MRNKGLASFDELRKSGPCGVVPIPLETTCICLQTTIANNCTFQGVSPDADTAYKNSD